MDEDPPALKVTVTLDLPGGPGTNAIAIEIVLDVLNHLEHDGLRPYRTVIDIVEHPTA